jgi:hypothetical protein
VLARALLKAQRIATTEILQEKAKVLQPVDTHATLLPLAATISM